MNWKKICCVCAASILLSAAVPQQVKAQTDEEYWDIVTDIAICVQAEAGNQDQMGKRLVADVILNRVDSNEYPDTVFEVISQKNQFSSYWDGGMNKVQEIQESTIEAVIMELAERTDRTIMYFTAGRYGKYGSPAYKHGDHYFCRR